VISKRATSLLTSLLVGFWPSRFDARTRDDELAELDAHGFVHVSGGRRGLLVVPTVEGQRFIISEKKRSSR